ncbi:hypothetical protein [Thalassotalea aquiviva]|uniref:hypothetical protein n=1 Tax=Thalassotalea aquiviva TaxID=3242415 RepID=UPI00352B71C8
MYTLKRQMIALKFALNQEKQETKDMLKIYHKYTQRQASDSEIKAANQQFFDLLKGVGLGVFAILPFAPITIPILIKVASSVGVELLPSAFISSNTRSNKKNNK